MTEHTSKVSLEEKLCADLITMMEDGVNPWRKPWIAAQGQHRNPLSGATYTGANPIVLEMAAAIRGTDVPLWAGYGQSKAQGWFPRKGSKAAVILRPLFHKREEIDENGERSEVVWTTFTSTNVFNLADLVGEGVTDMIDQSMGEVQSRPEPERLEAAEKVLGEWEVKPSFGGSRAFYMPSTDSICLPSRKRFESAAAIVGTWAHEAVHSTGHKTRLKRDLSGKFGTDSYAREELVAELGAFLVCRRLEVDNAAENHAAYLSSWISILRESPKVLLKVLSDARKAADLITNGAG